jgi:ABC-type multidrug transport system permease subunit
MFARLDLWYDIDSRTVAPLTEAVQNYSIPGLYCGIFAMYLQYHASIEGTKKMLLFYSLSVLYLLSTGVLVCYIAISVIDAALLVSNNDCVFFL